MSKNFKLLLQQLALVCFPIFVQAQGTAFTYQGRLNNNGALAGGNYDLRFTIYDSSGGPTVVAGPLTNSAVAVSNGLFTVMLDFGASVFTGPALWLEIGARTNAANTFATLNPHRALTASPYATYAGMTCAARHRFRMQAHHLKSSVAASLCRSSPRPGGVSQT